MPVRSRIDVAFLGAYPRLQQFLEMVPAKSDLRVVGWSGERPEGAVFHEGVRFYAHPGELLDQEQIQAVVNCAPLEERGFWSLRALEAGKSVLSENPPCRRYEEMRQVLSCCRATKGRHLAVASPAFYGSIGREMARTGPWGTLRFFELEIQSSRRWLAQRARGGLLLNGADYLGLVGAYWGRIDSLWAQSRTLVSNRPTEDVAVIYLKFRDGKEGLIVVNGLGERDLVQLKLFGRCGSGACCEEQEKGWAAVWEPAIQDFVHSFHASSTGEAMAGFDSQLAGKGFWLMNWINQSARSGREVYSREVVDDGC